MAIKQVYSVIKILTDLELNTIPTIVVLNKADISTRIDIEDVKRQIEIETGLECIAVSALRKRSLNPLIKLIGETLSRDLFEYEGKVSAA
jgi:50S ribosomal subunit-associated GTPase HflX